MEINHNNIEYPQVELLSPAGDLEKLKVAIAYGADAVYLAGQQFGLRAGSGNFNQEEMKIGIDYAHQRGVKCYVTMNIFAHQRDIAFLDDEILFYVSIGVDAIIVSDVGVFRQVKLIAPNMEIHISTQANVTNALGCLFWYELGAKRIVLARELTLEEIIQIKSQIPMDLELECFIHGAMCMAYSGRCLLSNHYTNRGANQGACAQPCRWKYHTLDIHEEKRPDQVLTLVEDERGTYIFNSKDMCLINYIPELIQAGIHSFKIEGRIKGAFYVASTTKAYRQAIDCFLKDPSSYQVNINWQMDLERTVHRAFGTGFYFDEPMENGQIFSEQTYIQPAFVAAVVIGYDQEKQRAIVSQRNKIKVGDTLEIISPNGYVSPMVVEVLWDEELNPIESTPKAKMTYYLPVPQELPPFTFLCRLGKKEGE